MSERTNWVSGVVELDIDHTTPPIWAGVGLPPSGALVRVCGCRQRVHNRGETCPSSYLTQRLGPR
jgi:hypothetical protein